VIDVEINSVPISCINTAAITYSIPSALIISILKKEHGKIGEIRENKNGSYDYGVYQINSIWLKKIEPFGYTKNDILYDPCKSTMVASWIIAKGLAETDDLWTGVGYYHSYTSKYNQSYNQSIQKDYKKIVDIIHA